MYSQQKSKVYFIITDSTSSTLSIPNSTSYNRTEELPKIFNNTLNHIIENGFLAASIDSIIYQSDSSIYAHIHLGQQYIWSIIDLSPIPIQALNKSQIRKIDWEGKKISPKQLGKLHKALIQYYENTGYPYASVSHHVSNQNNNISTQISIDKGKYIEIDTIIIHGDVDIDINFIEQYLDIKQGAPYQEKKIRDINNRLKNLPFLEAYKPWELLHTIAKNELHFYFRKKKSNQLNGLIGVQPNNNETGKMLITIDALLDLNNSFGYGEHLKASFQNLQKGSPKLLLSGTAPYIMGLPLAIDGDFNLYKRDTMFTRINFDGGAKYLLSNRDYIKLAYINTSTRVNYVDLNFISREKRLPDIVDAVSNGIGLSLYLDKTNYSISPSKGWMAHIQTQALKRKVKENLQIITHEDNTGYDYASLYDSFKQASNQYKILLSASYYLPITQSIIGKIGYQSAYIESNNLFLNELYQIGGYNNLRGFDEESIFANQYHIATAEIRLLFNQNSFFYVFSDLAHVQSNFNLSKNNKNLLSIGGGVQLYNNNGIFKIAIGVGKDPSQPFMLRQAKLHFGYTALF